MCFFVLPKTKKLALLVLVAYLSSGLATQVLKNLINAPRPQIYFEASQYLFDSDNFSEIYSGSNSFPSGHTTSAFALATVFAVYFKRKYLSVLLLAAAALVGYSRIYLAQHFPADVLGGAFTGILFATLSIVLLNSTIKISLPKKQKGHHSSKWDTQIPGSAVYQHQ